jgi:hypothetical protein
VSISAAVQHFIGSILSEREKAALGILAQVAAAVLLMSLKL